VRADGSGKVVWESKTKVYVPSMLMHRGYLYAVTDAGVATCWKAATGKEAWASRLEGAFTASPVLVSDRIYATNETGRTFIFKATPDGLDVIAENQLGNEVLATPAICGGCIYMRVAVNEPGAAAGDAGVCREIVSPRNSVALSRKGHLQDQCKRSHHPHTFSRMSPRGSRRPNAGRRLDGRQGAITRLSWAGASMLGLGGAEPSKKTGGTLTNRLFLSNR
jgi:outer membrane protein assembly factor BamB